MSLSLPHMTIIHPLKPEHLCTVLETFRYLKPRELLSWQEHMAGKKNIHEAYIRIAPGLALQPVLHQLRTLPDSALSACQNSLCSSIIDEAPCYLGPGPVLLPVPSRLPDSYLGCCRCSSCLWPPDTIPGPLERETQYVHH